MTFDYYVIDEDGDVFGTNSKRVADSCDKQGWAVIDTKRGLFCDEPCEEYADIEEEDDEDEDD